MAPTEASSLWLERIRAGLLFAIGIATAALAVWLSGWGVFNEVLSRALPVLLGVVAAVLLAPTAIPGSGPLSRNLGRLIDLALIVCATVSIAHFITLGEELQGVIIYEYSRTDRLYGLLGLIPLLEATRRHFGLPLFLVCVFALAYALFGNQLPWIFEHAGFSYKQVVNTVWYSFDGVFGQLVAVVTSVILIYIVFGTVLESTGAGRILLKIVIGATGRLRGGPAHAAVVASALFGSISGSVSGNVVSTGVFTMPMIKKRGFSATFAGAVEAAASSGGQFMPPVMGAVAFIMADVTRTPYLVIAAAALVPALFYYASLFLTVSVEAARQNIQPIPPEEREKLTLRDWVDSLLFIVPLTVIVVLLVMGRSPALAGFWALIAALVMGLLLDRELLRRPQKLIAGIAKGGENGARIIVVVAAIGTVVGVLNMTGLGLRVSNLIAGFATDALIVSLILTMIGSLVLGMGLPTVPAYLLIVVTIGPAITELGVPIIVAHLFVVYFGVLSNITPPVAVAAYAAAPICGAPPMQVGFEAVRVALAGFIIPFVFVFNPSLVLVEGVDWLAFIWISLRLLLAIWLMATGLVGFAGGKLTIAMRLIRMAVAIAVLMTAFEIHLPALVVAAGLIFLDRRRGRQINHSVSGKDLARMNVE